jgi:hypothetical protein
MKAFVVAGIMLATTPAFAGPFDDLAAKAQKIQAGPALAALFWAQTASCKNAGDDFQRRQCEGVKDARGRTSAGMTFLIVPEGAVTHGAWDKNKTGVGISVRGCLACKDPVDVGGERRYVTTKGNTSIQGGQLRGPEIHKGLYKAATAEAAERFTKVVFPRLVTELLFKVPARADAWTEGGARGYAVELVGVRVYDPCDGTVVHATPASDKLAPDPTACGNEPAKPKEPEQPKEPDKPKEPALPQRLSPSDIQTAMQGPRIEVNACFATYGVAGNEKVVMEIGGDGVVKAAKLTGDFVDTPTGDCILKAVKKATFPRFKASSMTVNFPFILN